MRNHWLHGVGAGDLSDGAPVPRRIPHLHIRRHRPRVHPLLLRTGRLGRGCLREPLPGGHIPILHRTLHVG